MSGPEFVLEPPSPWLLLRRGWLDPMLYFVVAGLCWIIYESVDAERNAHLEEVIGYSATRLAFITFLGILFWGTVQGMRKRLVVYINDATTPNYNDALATLFLIIGAPLVIFALTMMAYVATGILAPAGFSSPRYDEYGFALVCIFCTAALVWMYARLYAYNRGPASAFVALVTKLAWCLLAIHFFRVAWGKLTNDADESAVDAAMGFISNLILLFVAIFIISGLTYEGPSLREE